MLVEMDKKAMVVMMEAGYIYLGMKRFKEAKEVFSGIAAMAPDSDVPLVAEGNVEFCKGDFDKAIDYYDRALKKDKGSLFAKAYKAEALFFKKDIDTAKKMLKEVKKSDPEGGAGGFAAALLQAIDEGFSPNGLDEVKEME